MKFSPCTGECTEEGTHCEGCGRSQEDVAEMRKLVGSLIAYATEKGYENIEDFADGVAASIKFKMLGEH